MSAANPYWLILVAHYRPGYVMFSMKYGWLGVALFFIGPSWPTSPGTPCIPGRAWPRGAALSLIASTGASWRAAAVFLFGFGGYFAVQGVIFLLNS